MRFFSTVVAALALASGALAVDVQKDFIVTFPKETAESVVDRAMKDIKGAGGVITHEYSLIKGFVAKAPQKIMESVGVWTAEYHATIEEDKTVQISTNTP